MRLELRLCKLIKYNLINLRLAKRSPDIERECDQDFSQLCHVGLICDEVAHSILELLNLKYFYYSLPFRY